jgi:Peptide methionine sulfoxide reductase
MAKPCEHLARVTPEDFPPQRTPGGFEECLAEGTAWVVLRKCRSSGHVGCCDSSPGKHVVGSHALLPVGRVPNIDDPTLNQQGADKGTTYRSAIFTHDAAQERIAKQIITDVQPLFGNQIVTEVKPFTAFFKR